MANSFELRLTEARSRTTSSRNSNARLPTTVPLEGPKLAKESPPSFIAIGGGGGEGFKPISLMPAAALSPPCGARELVLGEVCSDGIASPAAIVEVPELPPASLDESAAVAGGMGLLSLASSLAKEGPASIANARMPASV